MVATGLKFGPLISTPNQHNTQAILNQFLLLLLKIDTASTKKGD
ncbi:MAG: hypothetical protein ACJA2E_000046 [Arenicella sp.]|jgi:hypothetical protein